MNKNEICANCKFFKETPLEGKDQGLCRANPPKQHALGSQQGVQFVSTFPSIKKEDWCGRFEPEVSKLGIDN